MNPANWLLILQFLVAAPGVPCVAVSGVVDPALHLVVRSIECKWTEPMPDGAKPDAPKDDAPVKPEGHT